MEVNENFEFRKFFLETFVFMGQVALVIHFDDIDSRLEKLGKNRAWLAEASGRKLRSIGDALAPSSAGTSKRSTHLQRALSDAITAEENRQAAAKIMPAPPVPDRITIECDPDDRRAWQRASSTRHHGDLDAWIVDTLNDAAESGGNQKDGTTGP